MKNSIIFYLVAVLLIFIGCNKESDKPKDQSKPNLKTEQTVPKGSESKQKQEKSPDFPLGQEALKNNDFKRAEEYFTQVINFNPKDFRGYYYRGVSLMRQKKIDNAMKDFRKSVELKQDFFGSNHMLGWCYQNKKDYNNAIKYFSKAIELKPDNPNVYLSRGLSYRKIGDKAKASADMKKAMSLSQNNKEMKELYEKAKKLNK